MLVGAAELPHHGQNLRQADPVRQGQIARLLNHGAIGAGVGKRHAEFNDVGAPCHHGMHQFGGDVGEGKTCRDKRYQCLALLLLQGGQGAGYAAHGRAPAVVRRTGCSGLAVPLTACPWQLGRQ